MKRNSTVSSSGVVIDSRAAPTEAAVREWNCSSISSKVNLTSAEVNGVPSCHVTPSRRSNRYSAPSSSTSHDSASSGTGSSSGVSSTRPL